MNNALVSIIMPVYNSEDYIIRAIDSVLNQTYAFFELIIIDDGSTDGTGSILKKINDDRVKVFTKENGGPSKARNFGLKQATGKYIQFLDADDFLDENAVETYIREIEGYDMVIASYKTIDNRKVNITHVDMTGDYTSNYVAQNYLFLFKKQYIKHLWNKLYLKEIIDKAGLSFNESLKRGEGIVFNLNYFKNSRQIHFIDDSVYNHNDDNEDSITSKYLPSFISNTETLFQHIHDYMSQYLDSNQFEKKLDQLYVERMVHYIMVLVESEKPETDREKKKELSNILNNEMFEKAINHYEPVSIKGRALKILLKYRCVNLLYRYYTIRL